jgi:hypothetical protein
MYEEHVLPSPRGKDPTVWSLAVLAAVIAVLSVLSAQARDREARECARTRGLTVDECRSFD